MFVSLEPWRIWSINQILLEMVRLGKSCGSDAPTDAAISLRHPYARRAAVGQPKCVCSSVLAGRCQAVEFDVIARIAAVARPPATPNDIDRTFNRRRKYLLYEAYRARCDGQRYSFGSS